LDFARPLHAETHPADVTALLDRVVKTVGDRWTGKPVQVERHYARGLPLIPLDESLCEQAFLNLVQNAYEAMEESGGTLRVEVIPAVQDSRDGLEIRLTDSGPGVADAMREEIFNPFVTTKKTGVGLGLSIVSKIVDGHRGSIRVENGLAGGASFRLFFPLAETPQADQSRTDGRTGEHPGVEQPI
jgi:two-component system NtrC family sensor kinase